MPPLPPRFLPAVAVRPVRTIVICLFVALVAACQAGPPVQEMSDARQAIAVAREAGAEEGAADKLREAEASLQRAEENINRRSYAAARRDALEAKQNALDALSILDTEQKQQ